jgi:hypothetical protein
VALMAGIKTSTGIFNSVLKSTIKLILKLNLKQLKQVEK